MRRRALSFVCFAALLSGGAACTAVLGDFSTGPAESDAGSKKADGGLDARSSSKDGASGHDDASRDSSRDSPSTMEDVRPGIEASTGKVTAVATGQTVYVGLPATVDASGSTGSDGKLTYKWTFLTEPAGSVLVDSNLSSTTAATPSFIPDLPGDFVLQVTVKSGAATGTATATVSVVAPEVFYLEGTTKADGGFNTLSTDASATLAYYAVDYDGTNSRPVMCPEVDTTAAGSFTLPGILPFYAGVGFDIWEGEAGEAPRYAGFTYDLYDGGEGFATHLRTGTSASSCASPPVDLGIFPGVTTTPSSSADGVATSPRLNADGSRVVIYDSHFNLVTLATDGSNQNSVSPYFQGATSDASTAVYDSNPYGPVAPSPQWLGSKVAWARPTETGWEIVTAPDTANSAITQFMSCPGVAPREFQFFNGESVIVGYRATASGPENIYLLSKSCTVIHAYTTLSYTSAVARDFSISPDGNWLAFLQLDPSTQDAALWQGHSLPGGFVYIAPTDGTAQPTQITPDPALYGPRWIGGGSLLVYTKVGAIADGGAFPSTAAVVYIVDGGGEQTVARANGVSSTLATGGSGACSMSGRAGGPGAFAMLSIAAAAHFVRRRRRRAV